MLATLALPRHKMASAVEDTRSAAAGQGAYGSGAPLAHRVLEPRRGARDPLRRLAPSCRRQSDDSLRERSHGVDLTVLPHSTQWSIRTPYVAPPQPRSGRSGPLRRDRPVRFHRGSRTTLITAADTGDYRLFAAEHVIDEVFEHAARWCQETASSLTRSSGDGMRSICRSSESLPLAQLYSRCSAMTSEPASNVTRCVDPDDVSAITLAILLQGLYLSNDSEALWAVYGDRLDLAYDRGVRVRSEGVLELRGRARPWTSVGVIEIGEFAA
jgi:hypothetical protein